MNLFKTFAALGLGLSLTVSANAAEILVGDTNAVNGPTIITTSQTWTADNTYNLQEQVYISGGATLIIEPGTKVISDVTANGGGSLAIARGSKIYVQGTAEKPVIMTSKNDDFTNWRAAANEWGNLTIMGNGFISTTAGTQAYPDAGNEVQMEGLTEAFALYGGGNDDDNSGSITYLSIRFGGRVIGAANELNGLSLGGIGRETDIQFVEIMNNVDDGIEIWGGTVSPRNCAIWNVGDDSFDIDQGWRGCAQYIFIVQGYSLDASQGSGVSDNGFEHDGAEDSDHQPQTTGVIANATFIGMANGDGATTWRDNCNMQYWNSLFINCGEKVVRFDNLDGDGAQGYGHNGTLDWPTRWTTPYTHVRTVNAHPTAIAGDPEHRDSLYTAQVSGNLIGFYNSIFYQNVDYNEADARIVNYATNNNIKEPANSPIVSLVRGPQVNLGVFSTFPVATVDPRAANDAVDVGGTAPDNGKLEQVPYAGAFSADNNWLLGWSAADEYGFVSGSPAAAPDSTFTLNTTTVSFLAEAGKVYSVESSTDGLVWTSEAIITGTGAVENVSTLLGAGFDASAVYRAVLK